jgi:hypothetical protein
MLRIATVSCCKPRLEKRPLPTGRKKQNCMPASTGLGLLATSLAASGHPARYDLCLGSEPPTNPPLDDKLECAAMLYSSRLEQLGLPRTILRVGNYGRIVRKLYGWHFTTRMIGYTPWQDPNFTDI